MKKQASRSSFLSRYGLALLLTVGLAVLYYFCAWKLSFTESDYAAHGRWALLMTKKDMLASFYDGSEHLWHVLTRLTFDHLVHNLNSAAALVTALADAADTLAVMGYSKAESAEALRGINADQPLENIIKDALKKLNRLG